MEILEFTHHDAPQSFGQGLYFGMPEDIYHAIPALSSTGFKNLLVSAPDFYFNSWLNPLRAEDAEDDDAKEWRVFGKASHTRVLEGLDVFNEKYCVEYIAPKGCLNTVADLKQALAGMQCPSKWAKPDYIKAVQAARPDLLIKEVEEAKYADANKGKIQLTMKQLRRIHIAAAMIERHQELKHCFVGGFPEVTVIWYEDFADLSGATKRIWFKARFDYLKPRAIVDLKTFTNTMNRPIDQAIYTIMGGLKYHIQCCHYRRAALRAILFAQQDLINTYGNPIEQNQSLGAFINLLAKSEGHEFFFVFQKKGGAPLARGKRFSAKLEMEKCALASIAQAISLYLKYYEKYGNEIWVDDSGITDFEDGLFPVYATEY